MQPRCHVRTIRPRASFSTEVPPVLTDALLILTALVLVALNGFFVAVEFALVTARPSRLDALVAEGRAFAGTAKWLAHRLDASLSACQLGITMASLGLGWVGEPALAHLMEPVFEWVGIDSEATRHTIAFIIAFSAITALHLVAGEQVPKIFAIRRPEVVALACAIPLRVFYGLAYPFLWMLSTTTDFFLRKLGVEGGAHEHSVIHTEAEIRALLEQSRRHGELTRSEHRLLDAVFDFDDTICRRIMVPRREIEWFDVGRPLSEHLEKARAGRRTRYPVCEGSLDKLLGVLHIKDLVGIDAGAEIDVRSLLRPPQIVLETLPIKRLLRLFQATRQHLALVVDEHETVIGVVTLEDVLECIVGPVQDEFDDEAPEIVSEGEGRFLVSGGTQLQELNRRLERSLESDDVDTISGLVTSSLLRAPQPGDAVDLPGAKVEVLEVVGVRTTRLRILVSRGGETGTSDPPAGS